MEDYETYTKKKLIQMAKKKGLLTSGNKPDLIDRLESYDKQRRQTPSIKISQEEYDRQIAILTEETEMEEMEQALRQKQRRLRMLRLQSQLRGEEEAEDEEAESSEAGEADEPQGAEGGATSEPKRKEKSKNASLVELLSLPKPSLIEFDGNPLEYHMFISNFDSVVDAAEISDSAKLNRLFDVVKGKAKKIILPCAMGNPTTGYKTARQLLKKRYGDEYVISEAFINQLTTGNAIKQHEVTALQEFADDIRSCVDTLKQMKMLDEIDTRGRMVKIAERLPYAIQTRWRKTAISAKRKTGSYPDITEFVEFIEACVEEASDPVFGFKQKASHNQSQDNKQPKSSSFQASSEEPSQARKQVLCMKCEGNHPLFICNQFKAMDQEERLQLVKEKRSCINCLKSGHEVKDCRNPRVCGNGCNEKHSYLLHDALTQTPEPAEQSTTNGTTVLSSGAKPKGKICLPCVDIIVSNGSDRFLTKALLDSGSDRTYMKSTLADLMQLKGKTKQIDMETLHGIRQIDIKEVNCAVSSLVDGKTIELQDVYSTKQFPCLEGNVATKRDIQRWSHLSDLPFNHNQEVQLLIGQDNPEAFKIEEERFGEGKQPYAIRYALGWTISGPLQKKRTPIAVSNFAVATQQQKVSIIPEQYDMKNVNPDPLPMNEEKEVQPLETIDEVTENGQIDTCCNHATPVKNNLDEVERKQDSIQSNLIKDEEENENHLAEIEKRLASKYTKFVDRNICPPGLTWYIPLDNATRCLKLYEIEKDTATENHQTTTFLKTSKGTDEQLIRYSTIHRIKPAEDVIREYVRNQQERIKSNEWKGTAKTRMKMEARTDISIMTTFARTYGDIEHSFKRLSTIFCDTKGIKNHEQPLTHHFLKHEFRKRMIRRSLSNRPRHTLLQDNRLNDLMLLDKKATPWTEIFPRRLTHMKPNDNDKSRTATIETINDKRQTGKPESFTIEQLAVVLFIVFSYKTHCGGV